MCRIKRSRKQIITNPYFKIQMTYPNKSTTYDDKVRSAHLQIGSLCDSYKYRPLRCAV